MHHIFDYRHNDSGQSDLYWNSGIHLSGGDLHGSGRIHDAEYYDYLCASDRDRQSARHEYDSREFSGDDLHVYVDSTLVEVLNLGDIRKVAVVALVIQAVTNDEIVWNFESHIIDFTRNFESFWLFKQSNGRQRFWFARKNG